jgi:hypothetical protein
MTDSRTACAALLFAVCVASGMACSNPAPQQPPAAQHVQEAPPPQAAPPTQPAAMAAQAPAGPAALVSAQFSANPLIRCDILEVKRVSGNALIVRWRIVNTGTAQSSYDFRWEDLYYIDPAENKKYSYLTDSEGSKILQLKWGGMAPGEQWLNWAKFPAPPAGSTKISLSIGGYAPFEDLPVGQ